MRPNVEFLGVIADYLAERTTMRAMHEWLARHTAWLLIGPEDSSMQLAATIELIIAEIEAQHATEDDLRADVRRFISERRTLEVVMGVPDHTSSNAATSIQNLSPIKSQRTTSDTRLAAVFA